MSLTSGRQLLLSSAAAGSTQYQVSRSLRFNSADSAYLSRTPASAGNRKTWTWSGWVKRSAINSRYSLFVAATGGNNQTEFFFEQATGADTLHFYHYDNAYLGQCRTVAVFRDTSAWYHIVLAVDTTQATASNRCKIYVNGVQQDATFITNFTQNADLYVNATNAHAIGYDVGNAPSQPYYFSGYMAEIHFIDGQALTPSSFAETDATTGQWVPKLYSGSYGTNGFKLTFADNSNNTASTLGADSSGNGNHWSPTNLSVTAGAGNDSLVDTPTSYGTDDGLGGSVRGNYCTWNPLGTAGPASSNGNLDISSSSTAGNKIGTILLTSGKWYWECVGDGYAGAVVGVGGEGFTGSMSSSGSKAIGYWSGGGIYWDGGSFTSGIASYTTSDVIGVAVNMDAGTVAFYKNNSLVYTATFGSGTVPNLSSGVYPGFNTGNPGGSARTVVANFGQRSWAYAAPAGFKALCDTNLPAPVIAKPSTVMDVKLYTGNGSTQTISGLGFSPDFVWIKDRSQGNGHGLFDVIRGATKGLFSNLTNAEITDSNSLTSFDSTGFSTGSGGTTFSTNINGNSYVAWTWDAGSSTVTNTQGSITSSVRANASAGFSICTFTQPSSSNSFSWGHGLNVAPQLVFMKPTSSSGNWQVYHASTGAQYLWLNSTNAATGTGWSTVNSSVVTATATLWAGNFATVAYCFAPIVGYSSFGSYVGNGSSDGVFVYLGFRPKWLMVKRTDAAEYWIVFDAVRNTYNIVDLRLLPSASNAEGSLSTNPVDFLSNGFKNRGSDTFLNGSGATYIYAAFAESPFQYARAR